MCFLTKYLSVFFFFNDTATTEIYTLSLHDALPIWRCDRDGRLGLDGNPAPPLPERPQRVTGSGHRRDRIGDRRRQDRKSTRLNSSHANISYAVFCLKKKTKSHFLTQVYTITRIPSY